MILLVARSQLQRNVRLALVWTTMWSCGAMKRVHFVAFKSQVL